MKISRSSISGSSSCNRRYAVLLGVVLSALVIFCLEAISRSDIYASTPFCDADGTCHEKPDKASPRTIYSARSREQYNQWWKLHAQLNITAQSYADRRIRNARDGGERTRPLILLGDSITESWLGTNMGQPVRRAMGVPKVFEEMLSQPPATRLDPLILAISGDQTQHLLYRLAHGQLLPAYAEDPSTIFVVLIGTNNIGSGELPDHTANGVLEVADYILSNSQGNLLLLQNLPRGDGFRLPALCPPRCNSEGKPFISFVPAIQKLNQAVQEGVNGLAERHGSRRLGLLDCGPAFYAQSASEVDESLMPDLLHPNAAGHKVLGECFMNYIRGLEKG